MLVSATLQLAVNYVPLLQPVFHTTVPLSGIHWAFVIAIAAAPTVLGAICRHALNRTRQKAMYLKV
ncbi:MAG: cation transporting ATPase C-terminal domain-containing protein [Bacillota bacterium]